MDIYIEKYSKEHKLMMCSDGLTGMVPEDEILK